MGIPLTHLGVEDPVLPISVNAYLPPQPTIERCYAFGEAVAKEIGGRLKALEPNLWQIRKRPRRAVLPQRRAALHGTCRRQRQRWMPRADRD